MTISLDAVTAIVQATQDTFAGLSPLLGLVIAVPMLFYVSRRVAGLFVLKAR